MKIDVSPSERWRIPWCYVISSWQRSHGNNPTVDRKRSSLGTGIRKKRGAKGGNAAEHASIVSRGVAIRRKSNGWSDP